MKIKIGLETHVKVNLVNKLFCFCKSCNYNVIPNSNICVICLGYPGTLPILNDKLIDKILPFLSFLNGEISDKFFFDRKIYSYPDLPKNFQITQKTNPIVKNVKLNISNNIININNIAVEEDAGKMIHDDLSYIDFNRSGECLLEITTDPNFDNIDDLVNYIVLLRSIIRKFNISNLNNDNGDFRNDVNVSIFYKNIQSERMEIKNLNKISNIKLAIKYEINNLKLKIDKKDKVNIPLTLGWNEINNETFFMRYKTNYFFVFEKDIPVIKLKTKSVNFNKCNYDISFYLEFFNFFKKYHNLTLMSKILSNINICNFLYEIFLIDKKYNDNFVHLINFFISFVFQRFFKMQNFNLFLSYFLKKENLLLLFNLSKKIGLNELEKKIISYNKNLDNLLSSLSSLEKDLNNDNSKIIYDLLLSNNNIKKMFLNKDKFNFIIGESIKLLKSKNVVFNIKNLIKILNDILKNVNKI
jgi:aspartyl-tRNA(Asn)/glutamyl-tRNA(Gln) amidotransferase subunit B